jgi:hypothetical protein
MTGPFLNTPGYGPSWNQAANRPASQPFGPLPFLPPTPPLPAQQPTPTARQTTSQPPLRAPISLKEWRPDPSMVQSRELQSRYPQAKAHLGHTLPFDQVFSNTRTTLDTLNKVRTHTPVKDHQLGILDDQSKRVGSLLIAAMATWGLKQRIFGVGEFLGFLSWYFAMSATPKIVNGLVRLKTGANLNHQYYSNDGIRQELYKDPGYLPLHLLPNAEIDRVANRLGIAPNAPDKRKQVEERLRRISIQAHTWWMLIAGPATPIISGLICDRLQDPATRWVNRLKLFRAKQGIEQADGEKLARKTEQYVRQVLGEVPESELSMWWKKFGTEMVRQTGLDKKLSIRDVVESPPELVINKMAEHFSTLSPGSSQVKETLRYLDRQNEVLARLKEKADIFLESVKDKLDEKFHRNQNKLIEARIANAEMTIRHHQRLIQAVEKGGFGQTALRRLMEESRLTVVQRMLESGRELEARKIVGNPGVFAKIRTALGIAPIPGNPLHGTAPVLMGASPEAHLLTSLKDSMLRKLWQRRVLGYGGGGLLLATLLYTGLVVGRVFKDKPKVGAHS